MKHALFTIVLALLPYRATASVLVGDIDGDGRLSVADVSRLVDCIKTPDNYYGGIDYVDLGLPSGLLWATSNVGATQPEGYGYHYAWGETTVKDSLVWATYKWGNSSSKITKYCLSSSYGTADNKSTLKPEDDAAHIATNSDWHIPSLNDWLELTKYSTIVADSINHVHGYYLTSNRNGEKIFLPCSGFKSDKTITNKGYDVFYWANGVYLTNSSMGYGYYLGPSYQGWGYRDRYLGNPIRPVIYPYETVCDVNADGKVNLTDVIYLANLVMNAR